MSESDTGETDQSSTSEHGKTGAWVSWVNVCKWVTDFQLMWAAICNKRACTSAQAIRTLKGEKDQKLVEPDFRNVQDLWHLCALFSFKTTERQCYTLFWKNRVADKKKSHPFWNHKTNKCWKWLRKRHIMVKCLYFTASSAQFLLCPSFESHCICWRLNFVTLCWNGFHIMKVQLTNRLHVSP